MNIRSTSVALTLALSSSTAFAASRPDLTVNIAAPAGVYVGDPGTYEVVVANITNKAANAVTLTIQLPRTNTSPVVHILGTLGAFDNRCTRSGAKLTCSLGTLGRYTSTSVGFTIALPQSSAPLVVTADVTTSTLEVTTTNNRDVDTAYLLHLQTAITPGQTSNNRHCTGTNLTSFFECELYPSSISSHDIQFLPGTALGGPVAFIGITTTYTGTWSQAAGPDRLVLEYYDGASLEARFEGYTVNGGCFEGLTTFFPTSPYVAPYRVCPM